MKSSQKFATLGFRATSTVIGLLVCIGAAGQTYTNSTPISALTEPQSRAKEKADDIVSLSPDKIISLLRQEAGLLLQVKKQLVKGAYAEGRILGAEDLTDESLFRLIEQDDRVRIIATREIEERGYISVNPTREEIQAQNNKRYPTKWTREKVGRRAVHDGLSSPEGPSVGHRHGAPSFPTTLPTPEYAPAPLSPQYLGEKDHRQLVSDQTKAPDYPRAESGTLNRASRTQTEELPEVFGDAVSRDGWAGTRQPGMADSTTAGFAVRSSAIVPDPRDTMERRRPALASGPGIQTSWSSNTPAAYHMRHPYSDLPSFYDLHWKYSRRSSRLARFGEEVFRNRTEEADELPADIPAGRDYVVGPGDGLTIELWGGVSQRLQRVIDREGRLSLPEAGPIQVAGRNLGELQQLVQTVMRTQFHDVQADVSLSRLRTVHIYVVGDVERPGAYDVSSLSSPLNALYLAGGPTPQGSMRVLGHYRDKQLVQQVDLYDLLLHGIRSSVQRLEPGDVVQVSPLGAQVAIEGMVRRPAIYELNGETNLAEVLELAGGVLPSASLRHVDVERTEVSHGLTRLGVDIPEDADQKTTEKQLSSFTIKDGDKIKISPVLPHADKTVYLDGHVFRPGKFAYHEGMKVRDLIHSYDDLLPEPAVQHAEIIRLNPPDYTPAVLTFNLADALSGQDQNLVLKPFDTVRIFSRFDFEDPPVVTVSGEVRDPGDHLTNGAIHLRDAIYLAGGATPDTLLEDAQIFRNTSDGKLRVLSVNLAKALAGDENDNLLLAPKDRVVVHQNPTKSNPPMVTIQGEVANPGKYPLDSDMTAAALVRLAGGFQRGAYTQAADLTSHNFSQGKKLLTEHRKVAIAEALGGRPDSDIRLHDGDVLTIGRLEGWKDLGATVALQGEIVHPGSYGIEDGERLSSVIERAGGLRADAYPYGTVFERAQVRELEEKNRAVLIREVQDQEPSLMLAPDNEPQQKTAKQAVLQQWKGTLEQLQNTPPPGRLVIHISSDLKRWANSFADIPVRAGDLVYVPKKPNMIVVNGSVYNPTAISFKPGKDAGWYLQQAGGPTSMANKKAMFVIRADGSVAGGSGGLFSGGVERAALQPGDMVVVPEKAFSTNTHWKTTLEGAQLAYAVGIAIQVARSF